jgi:magnesium chelatase subunit I
MSSAERRAIIFNERETQVWISDLAGIIPAITGKIELVYEGEQEGPYQVALNLVDKAVRSLFAQHFPNPETLKKRKSASKPSMTSREDEDPYKAITRWFDKGNHLDLMVDMKDSEKIAALYKVESLHSLVKKFFPRTNEQEVALMMEFVLHGLAAHSMISKKIIEGRIQFKDLIGSMMNLGSFNSDDDFNDDDFK